MIPFTRFPEPCPKCRSTRWSREFHYGHTGILMDDSPCIQVKEEHLLMTCVDCGFQTIMEPADEL